MTQLEKIEKYFKENTPLEEAVRLDQCTVISNPENFVKSSIEALKANSGNERLLPYFERLNKFYKLQKLKK